MTLAQLRDKANAKLADMWPVIQAKEDAYFANHGRYFGLNWSPALEVVDGVDTTLTLDHPTVEHVAADVTFSETVPYQIQIFRMSQYDNEYYHVYVRVKLPNGDVWQRDRKQDNTDSGWYQVIPLII